MKRIVNHLNSFLLLLLLLIPVLGAPLKSQAQPNLPSSYFEAWDADLNRKLTHAEFFEGLSRTGLFESWDSGKDGYIVRQEFYSKTEQVFPQFSASLQEYESSQRTAFTSYLPGREGSTAPDLEAANNALFILADLNRDGKLNKGEFYTLIFRFLDQNENGFLDATEGEKASLLRWFIL